MPCWSNITHEPTWIILAAIAFCSSALIALLYMNIQLYKTLQSRSYLPENGSLKTCKSVSVIIPAKDEAETIEKAVYSIRQSIEVHPEIILVNDRSVDNTLERMRCMASNDPQTHIVVIEEKSPGWTGKTYAMWQGAMPAKGEILVFTDADVIWAENTLLRTLNFFERQELDTLSMLPGFTTRGFLENCVHVHLALGFACLSSIDEVNTADRRAAVASGCFIMVTREAYTRLGGWAAFRTEITEDVAFSRAAKGCGMKYHLLQDSHLVRTRPFCSLAELTAFWTRTFYGGLERRIPALLELACTYAALFAAFLMLLFAMAATVIGGPNILMILLFAAAFLATLAFILPTCFLLTREKVSWAWGLTAPLGVLISFYVIVRTLVIALTKGGIRWRGSLYK